ncbi:MAG TPA: phage tail protein, partial [Burkholderiaceae bacterium]|nr:phage tail protein [Burkholderiaceae bacterium]
MVTLHVICDVAIARNVAQILLQRELYVRNTYQFTVGWRYGRLEPMDIVTLTEPGLGLDQTLVRIVSVDENEGGELAVEAEDLTIGVATAQAYATQPAAGHVVDNNENPGSTFPPVIFQPPVELSGVPQIWIGAAGG